MVTSVVYKVWVVWVGGKNEFLEFDEERLADEYAKSFEGHKYAKAVVFEEDEDKKCNMQTVNQRYFKTRSFK